MKMYFYEKEDHEQEACINKPDAITMRIVCKELSDEVANIILLGDLEKAKELIKENLNNWDNLI